MKKSIFLDKFGMTIMVLVGALAWTGCEKAGLIEEKPEEQQAAADGSVWTVSIQAEKSDAPQTKGLAIEGEEATTTMLKSIWKESEEVKAYLGTTLIGTLTAAPDATDAHKATLSGTVNTTGLEAGVSTLTLITPRETWDYTGQVGTLLGEANSIEKMYHYTAATGVLVTAVDAEHGAITTENASFVNQQSIYRLSFRYKVDESTKNPITAKKVTITSAGGHLVQSKAVDGSSQIEGPIAVALGTASANPFFVALRNGDETSAENLTFTVVDAEGVTYRGTKTIPAEYKPNGTFVSMKNATLDLRLGASLSSTTVSSVW